MFERLPFIQWEAAGQCRTVHQFQETGCATCWKNSTASFKADTCDSRTLSTPAGCGSSGSSAPRVIQPCTISQLMINQETHQSPSPYNKYWQVLSSDNAEWRIVKSTSANKTGGTKTETTLKNMKTPHFPKPRNFRNTPTCSKDMQLPPSLWTRLQVLPQFSKPKTRTTSIIRLDCKCSWQNLYDPTSCVPHLLLSMAYRHINNPMVNNSFGAQLLKHRRFALVSSAADSALLSPNLHPPAKWEIYQGSGNTWRFPNYIKLSDIYICKKQSWPMYGSLNVPKPWHCCLHQVSKTNPRELLWAFKTKIVEIKNCERSVLFRMRRALQTADDQRWMESNSSMEWSYWTCFDSEITTKTKTEGTHRDGRWREGIHQCLNLWTQLGPAISVSNAVEHLGKEQL